MLKLKFIIPISLLLLIIFLVDSNSKSNNYQLIELKNVSKYNEDRVAYQRIENFTDPLKDNSVECLLIIKSRKIYFMKDGHDEKKDVEKEILIKNLKMEFQDDVSFWKNIVNGKPDFIKIANRRIELLSNKNEEFVAKNFGAFYKAVRDKFLTRHVEIFKQLMRNRGESFFKATTKPIIDFPGADADKDKKKFAITASAKSLDETVYYCEDIDGDGITETFKVNRNDKFNWGTDSGPNIIFIYGNKDKDIETIIGKLAHDAVYGSVEEEKKVIETFPNKKDINNMIDDIIPDQNFYSE